MAEIVRRKGLHAMNWKIGLTSVAISTLIMATQACAPKVASEKDCHFVQNSLDQRVSWTERVPVTLTIHQSVPLQFHNSLREAANWWNQKANREIISISPGIVGGPIEPLQDGRSVIYFMDTWESDAEHLLEQGRTSIYWRGDQIIEADVRFNGFRFGRFFSVSQPVPGSQIDMTSLAIHEFGHVLGLSHIEDDSSVMKKYLAAGENRLLAAGKIEADALACEY